MLKLFRRKKKEIEDPIVGSAVAGHFHIRTVVHEDEFSRLYVGVDIRDQSTIGVRVARNHQSHAQMLEWLSRAMLSARGKDVILAIGHFDENKNMYVVLSEAALEITRPQGPEWMTPYMVRHMYGS